MALNLSTVKKVNVSDEVYNQILTQILDKNLQPGDKLPSEAELVSELSVSRVSVRAALQRLAGAGIVEIVNGEGTFVRHPRENVVLGSLISVSALENYDFEQIMDFRRGIEIVSAELAAKNGTAAGIQELSRILHEMEMANEENRIADYTAWDLKFHLQIANMSKNTFIMYTMQQLEPVFQIHLSRLQQRYGSNEGFAFHRELCQRIAAHDPEGAVRCAGSNLEYTQKRVLTDEKEGDIA